MKVISVIVIFSLVSWFMVRVPHLTAYVHTVKSLYPIPVSGNVFGHEREIDDSELQKRVKDAATKYSEPPIDARIDQVWQAIPGYNGLVVDEERTLQLARKRGGTKPLQLVFREMPPRIQLEDLPAQPIYRGNEHKPMVALMINVAWGTEYLRPMLDILEQENVQATFFLDGSWLAKHSEEGRLLVERGHEIGNHAYHHPQMSQLTAHKVRQEIEQTEYLIESTLGVNSRYFAPPSGDFNEQVVCIAADLGLYTVLWTADTVDWRPSSTPQIMVQRVSKQLGNGTLILMHPTDRTVEALPEIIQTIKKRELKLGTVAEVLSEKRISSIEAVSPF